MGSLDQYLGYKGRWHRKAESLYAQVLQYNREHLPLHDKIILETMASLISTYRALDQVSEAGTLNQEPLDIYTISLGCADDTTLHHAAIKANILYEQERYSEAAALKLDIFATRVSSLSLYDPKTLEAKENLSKTYLAEGRYAKAAAYAEKVLEAREKADELDTDKDMIATIENLKDIYIAAGRPDDATVMARREDVAKQGS